MADLTHLNVGFIKELATPNMIDQFIISLAETDKRPSELTLNEIQTAFVNPSDTIQELIRYNVTPETLFQDLRSYLTYRWFNQPQCKAETPDPSCGDIVWVHLALTKRTNHSDIRQLASLLTFVNLETKKLPDIIGRGLFFQKEKQLIERALTAAKYLVPANVVRLIGSHNFLKGGRKKTILLDLIKHYSGLGFRDVNTANVLLDIITENVKKPILIETIKDLLAIKGKVADALELDFNALYKAFDEAPADQPFKYSPLADTFGKHVARKIGTIGKADTKVVERMASILTSNSYDGGTRAMIAHSMGVIDYASNKAEQEAARQLYTFLKKTGTKEEKGLVHRHTLESIIALAKLDYTEVDDQDVVKLFALFARDMKHSEARVIGARALGILGMSPTISKQKKTEILQILSDMIGDPESRVVANTAYIWFNKIQSVTFPPPQPIDL